jgi:multiple sugar transport system ATP-binding protein
MASVRFENVQKVFSDGTRAVRDFSLEVADGEFAVLVGPSGCGKTTLLRLVAGLEDLTDGDILIGERIVNDVDARGRDVAMVFQNYALYPHYNVYGNIAFGLRVRGVPRSQVRQRVESIARVLGLQDLLERKPRQLSGGQRQRVAMGRAIVRAAGFPHGRAAFEPRREASRADARPHLPHSAGARCDHDLRDP